MNTENTLRKRSLVWVSHAGSLVWVSSEWTRFTTEPASETRQESLGARGFVLFQE